MGSLPFPNPVTTGQWAQDFLFDIGAPQTPSNIGYVEAWQHAESPSGYGYNPLGTEQPEAGSINANGAGVQAFRSWAQGLQATVDTLTNYKGNASLVARLRQGNASLAQLSAAQTQGSWATGGESSISALGSSTPFTYGGTMGEQPNAKGIATLGTSAPLKFPFPAESANPLNYPQQIVGDTTKTLVSGVFGPLVGWIEKGAADVTFVGFGLLLVVIGILVTFHSQTQDVAGAAQKAGEVAAA